MSLRQYDDQPEQQPTVDDAIREMQSEDSIPSPTVIYGLSNLTAEEFARLAPVWSDLDATYRRILMQMLADVGETNFELDYSLIGYANLSSTDAIIRQAAIEILQHDESLTFMNHLVQFARLDPVSAVRTEAVRLLGEFVLRAEWEEISVDEIAPVMKLLSELYRDTSVDLAIRRTALESISNSSADQVAGMIESAYRSRIPELQLGAVTAMGRTCDERWERTILKELESNDPQVVQAAIRAAGELQSEESLPLLKKKLLDADRDELEVIIWSLGEIGGRESTRILEQMLAEAEDEDDDDLIECLEDAIGNASIANGDFRLIDFDED
jgi:hypothetical protein